MQLRHIAVCALLMVSDCTLAGFSLAETWHSLLHSPAEVESKQPSSLRLPTSSLKVPLSFTRCHLRALDITTSP
ncbi:hypothetical protein K438DRAFT_1858105 [Mycena galopus ATCC 62051]|nr:hypothetical protein K438DRAFT_1859159 [Mycena galopus ATCC 62051]KAF8164275.1 hypothetical protein K438DRAFT_1858105 [Mycena galopus ATCC 62051]